VGLEITLIACNGSLQINKAVIHVPHTLPLHLTHLHTLEMVKTYVFIYN
jgi:hypothetical protein